MTDRVVIRSGSGATPPVAMLPGELAYTPEDGLLWLGGFGAGRPVRSGGASLSEVNAVIAANAPGFQTASQVNTAVGDALAGPLVFDGGTF